MKDNFFRRPACRKSGDAAINSAAAQGKMFSREDLRKLIVPLLIEQLLLMLVGMVDTIMVSRAGEADISGVSIVNDINALVIQLLAALAGGGAVCVTQYLGNHDEEDTRLASSQLVMITAVISSLIAVFNLVLYRQILDVLYGSVDTDVMKAARIYFRITALSFPFLGIYNSGTALFRSMNKTDVTMRVSILMNTINIAGNYLGVYILNQGVAGVAWPTLISRVAASFIIICLAFNRGNSIYIEWSKIFRWNRSILRKILAIAVPNGTENGLFQLGKILVSIIVATYGTSQIAANGVMNSLSTLNYTSECAMELAVVTVIGVCVGAGDYDQADDYTHRMIRLSYYLVIANNVIVFLITPFALKLYHLGPETERLSFTLIILDCIFIAIQHPPAFVLPCCLRAAGDATYTMLVGVISMFLCRVGGSYILGTLFGMGVIGTKLAWYIDWQARIIFFVRRYRSGKWKLYRLVDKK